MTNRNRARGVRLSYGEVCEIKTNGGRVVMRLLILSPETSKDGPQVFLDMDSRPTPSSRVNGASFDWRDDTERKLREICGDTEGAQR